MGVRWVLGGIMSCGEGELIFEAQHNFEGFYLGNDVEKFDENLVSCTQQYD